MKMFLTIAAGFLLMIGGSHATPPPTGTVYSVVQVDAAGGIVTITNFAAANGLSTTGDVAAAQAAAAAAMSTGTAAQASADAAMSTGTAAQASADAAMSTGTAAQVSFDSHLLATNPHAITPAMIGAATSNQGVLADTAVQPAALEGYVSTTRYAPDIGAGITVTTNIYFDTNTLKVVSGSAVSEAFNDLTVGSTLTWDGYKFSQDEPYDDPEQVGPWTIQDGGSAWYAIQNGRTVLPGLTSETPVGIYNGSVTFGYPDLYTYDMELAYYAYITNIVTTTNTIGSNSSLLSGAVWCTNTISGTTIIYLGKP